MPVLSRRLTRFAVAGAAAVGLTLTIGGVGFASGGGSPNGPAVPPTRAQVVAASPAMAGGSEAQFITVAPCRIIDTRVAGGMLVNTARNFKAVAPYGAQGGAAAGCGIPAGITAVQVNVGAISQLGSAGYVKGWATGATQPNASLVNFDKSGPTANMVTVPVNGSGGFTLKTSGKAHLFVDIAGYYVKPLYVSLTPGGAVYAGISSGVVSTTHPSTGFYTVTFNRNVRSCAAVGSDIIFSGTRDVSPDVTNNADANTVNLQVTNSSNATEDTFLTLSLTC